MTALELAQEAASDGEVAAATVLAAVAQAEALTRLADAAESIVHYMTMPLVGVVEEVA